MTAWIWLSTLFSFAILIFLVIAGKETPVKFIRIVPMYVYGVACAASIVGLIGASIQHDTAATYVFSLFGMPFHEGFRVTIVTSILNLLLYLAALYAAVHPRARDFETAIRIAWWTFVLSLLILAPTLGQAAFAVYIVVLGSGWLFFQMDRLHKQIPRVYLVVLYLLLCLSYVAQTAPTWSAWHNLQTVELTRLYHGAGGAALWHSPGIVLWLNFFGFIGEAVAMILLFWLQQSERQIEDFGLAKSLLPSATLFGLTSLLNLRIVTPFMLAHGWQWMIVILDVLLAATPVVAMAFDFRPSFVTRLLLRRLSEVSKSALSQDGGGDKS